jgi:hypothetical protein
VSDLDLVATVDGPMDEARLGTIVDVHRRLDEGSARGLDLGCVYVDEGELGDLGAQHPTWTHGGLTHRILSGVTRAELVGHGFAVLGRPPQQVLPDMSRDDVRAAARAEVTGYWAWASRRPTMWLSPTIADLGLTSMARARYAMRTGRLLTKTDAVEQAHAPPWLVAQLRVRRLGGHVTSPRHRTAWIAWRDARRTVRSARRGGD